MCLCARAGMCVISVVEFGFETRSLWPWQAWKVLPSSCLSLPNAGIMGVPQQLVSVVSTLLSLLVFHAHVGCGDIYCPNEAY